jgi:hypothetical protein
MHTFSRELSLQERETEEVPQSTFDGDMATPFVVPNVDEVTVDDIPINERVNDAQKLLHIAEQEDNEL